LGLLSSIRENARDVPRGRCAPSPIVRSRGGRCLPDSADAGLLPPRLRGRAGRCLLDSADAGPAPRCFRERRTGRPFLALFAGERWLATTLGLASDGQVCVESSKVAAVGGRRDSREAAASWAASAARTPSRRRGSSASRRAAPTRLKATTV